jgi:hypothetical protein
MNGPRYKVAVVHGDLTPLVGGGPRREQLSAHVLDRLCAHRAVATFRSEGTRSPGYQRDRDVEGGRRGRAGAITAATALADEWNADEGFPKERAPVKVPLRERQT